MSNLPTIQPYTVEEIDANQAVQPYFSYDEQVNEPLPKKSKRPFIIVLIVFVVFVLIAIILILSGLRRPTQRIPQQNTERQAFIQWWGVFLPSEVVQPLIDEYKNVKPNVTIEYANKIDGSLRRDISIDQYKAELDRVLTSGNAVEVPDIFTVHNTWAGDYENFSAPSTVYDISSIDQQFYPAIKTDFTNSTNVFGIPLWIDNFAIIYNKSLLSSVQTSEPPKQWPEFQNLAKSLTVKRNNVIDQSGFAAGSSGSATFDFELFNIILAQNGVRITDEIDNLTLNRFVQEFEEAFSFYKSFGTGPNATWSNQLGQDVLSFLEGRTAMIFVPSWRLRQILKVNEEFELGIDIGITPIPQVVGQEEEFYNWTDYWGSMVAKGRSYTREAWDFLFWLSQPEQLRKLSANIKSSQGYFGILYPRSDMSNDLTNDEYLRVFNESLANSKSWKMIKGEDVKEEFYKLMQRTSVNESIINSFQNSLQSIKALKGLLGD